MRSSSSKISALLSVLAFTLAGCSDSTDSASQTTTTSTSQTSSTTTSSTVVTPSTIRPPISVDQSWERFTETFFVWGIPEGDVLNVRTDAGMQYDVIIELLPEHADVVLFDTAKQVGSETWRPIQVGVGAGWVNARYLRPTPPTNVAVLGSSTKPLIDAAERVVDALRDANASALADLISPIAGVTIAPHAFVSPDAQTLSVGDLKNSATDTRSLLWGYTDGKGDPINETIQQRLIAISGSTSLTSTTTVGYDVRVKTGNSIDNIAQRFPGDAVVEYHFAGTSRYRDFDWTSVRLVFDVDGPTPLLVAIAQDTWTV